MPLRHRRPLSRALAALLAGVFLSAVALAEGKFTAPGPGQILAAGDTVEARWLAGCAESESSESELVLSIDGGMTFPIRVSPEMEACTEGFRWQVPALPTTRARLALRSGSGEGSAEESLQVVSEEFAILAVGAWGLEDLVRGPLEWWTRQALTAAGAEDLLSRSMTRPADRIVAADFLLEISEPDPPGLFSPLLSPAVRMECEVGRLRVSPPLPARPTAASLPLRL